MGDKSWDDYIASDAARKAVNETAGFYPERSCVTFDFQDIEAFSQELADELLANPSEVQVMLSEKVCELGVPVQSGERADFHVLFGNLPDEYVVPIDRITNRCIGKIIRTEGLVTKISDVFPRPFVAHFVCNRCGEIKMERQHGAYSGSVHEPVKCENCDKKEFRFIPNESKWLDCQLLEIQQKPERVRAGENPARLTVWLQRDLVRRVTSTSSVAVDGILKLLPRAKGSQFMYTWILEAHAIEQKTVEFEDIQLSDDDITEITEFSKKPNIINIFTQSMAPTIYGHDELKKAIVLQLFGGTEKQTVDVRRRSEINILMVGDPGLSKSVLAESAVKLSPKGIFTSGTDTTHGGLTSTAEKDALTGEWMIKAGALPMASGGLLVVDEFTNLEKEEVDSLKEAMERGVVTSTKAGINIRFKAEASILAAANPTLGRFDNYKPISEQFDIPPPVLSRFDLIFIMRDVMDSESDRKVADAILDLHTGRTDLSGVIPHEKLRKYIAYARRSRKPKVTDGARSMITEFYVKLRKSGYGQETITATPRQIEAIIRVAEAAAKMRLSNEVAEQDAQTAIDLFNASMSQVAYDEEAGIFDVDKVVTGKPKSLRDKITRIETLIEELCKNSPDKLADRDEAAAKAEETGINKYDFERVLDELKKCARIYEPRHGKIGVTND